MLDVWILSLYCRRIISLFNFFVFLLLLYHNGGIMQGILPPNDNLKVHQPAMNFLQLRIYIVSIDLSAPQIRVTKEHLDSPQISSLL